MCITRRRAFPAFYHNDDGRTMRVSVNLSVSRGAPCLSHCLLSSWRDRLRPAILVQASVLSKRSVGRCFVVQASLPEPRLVSNTLFNKPRK